MVFGAPVVAIPIFVRFGLYRAIIRFIGFKALWEGRFKSSLVQSEYYLLSLYQYIELNPVRAGMVKDPGDYSFSSYQINALGKKSNLCTPHEEYLLLGDDPIARQQNYRALFEQDLDGELIDDIRKITNQGMAIGNHDFIKEIEGLTGYDMTCNNRGRPKRTISNEQLTINDEQLN